MSQLTNAFDNLLVSPRREQPDSDEDMGPRTPAPASVFHPAGRRGASGSGVMKRRPAPARARRLRSHRPLLRAGEAERILRQQGDEQEAPTAPRRDKQHRFVPRPIIQPMRVRVSDVLLENVEYQDWSHRGGTAKPNAAAIREGWGDIPFHFVAWDKEEWMDTSFDEKGRQKVERAFLDIALGHHEPKPLPLVPHIPQEEDFLNNEATVADIVRQNVLLPIAHVLTAFLHPDHHYLMRVRVAPQVNSETSRLDHVLVLEITDFRNQHARPLHIPLVVVEEKAAGLIHPTQWEAHNPFHDKTNAATIHLPQILLYASTTVTERYFATDGNSWIALHVDRDEVLEAKRHAIADRHKADSIAISRFICTTETHRESENPLEYGPRMSVCMEGLWELIELGVVDMEYFGLTPQDVDLDLHPGIAQYLHTQTSAGVRLDAVRRRRKVSPSEQDFDRSVDPHATPSRPRASQQ